MRTGYTGEYGLKRQRGRTQWGGGRWAAIPPPNRNSENIDFVDTMINVLVIYPGSDLRINYTSYSSGPHGEKLCAFLNNEKCNTE